MLPGRGSCRRSSTGTPVSKDGRTYTFTLKQTFRFHTGARVTAQSFADAFNRDAQPRLASPATAYMREIVGATSVIDGKAQSISGVRVLGRYRLQIRLTRPVADFTARLSMPFFCPILPNTPITEINDPGRLGPLLPPRASGQPADRAETQPVLPRRPSRQRRRGGLDPQKLRGLRGRRRAEPDRLLLPRYYRERAATPGREVRHQPARRAVLRQSRRSGPPSSRSTTTGPRSGGRARSRSRRRSTTRSTVRRWPASSATSVASPPTRCSRPRSPVPRASTRSKGADPATARKWLARATITPTTLVLYADNTSQGVAIAQTLVHDLKQIGIDVQVKYFFVNVARRQGRHAR